MVTILNARLTPIWRHTAIIISLFAFLGFSQNAFSVTTTFTGSGNWDDTMRWSAGVPTSGDTVDVNGAQA